jgi:hypothetical protein
VDASRQILYKTPAPEAFLKCWANRSQHGGGGPPSRLRDRCLQNRSGGTAVRKSKRHAARLNYLANTLMDNRHGLAAEVMFGVADGFCERVQALAMLARLKRRTVSIGADKTYDTVGFVSRCAALEIEAHCRLVLNLKASLRLT